MFKKTAVLCLVLFIGLSLGVAPVCLAEDANNLEQAKQNVFSLLEAGDFNEADLATNQLIADFSGKPGLDEAIHRIATKHQEAESYQKENYQKEIELSRYVIANWPKSVHAVWAQMDIVMANLLLDNDAAAEAEVGALEANYKGDPNLPLTLDIVGYTCMVSDRSRTLSKRYGMAKGIFEDIIQKYPESKYASRARFCLRGTEALSLIYSSDFAAADEALDKLEADFPKHPDLPITMLVAGEQYYKDGLAKESNGLADQARNRFERAVRIWDGLINRIPDSALVPETCCWAGDCYYKLGEYEDSIRCFQKVVNNHPSYEHAWHALFMVGRSYESMKDSGFISESDANSKIEAAYAQLLEKYPACPAAQTAREWIDQKSSK